MGYYTDFNLTVESAPGQTADLAMIDEVITTELGDVFNDGEPGSYYGNAKWYGWRADMAELSRRFPEALFYLEGHGENGDDIWGWYFLNGWEQTNGVEIIYNRFDPAYMQPSSTDSPPSPLFEPNPTIDTEQLDKLLVS